MDSVIKYVKQDRVKLVYARKGMSQRTRSISEIIKELNNGEEVVDSGI